MAGRQLSIAAALLACVLASVPSHAQRRIEGREAVSADQVAPAARTTLGTEQVNRQPQSPVGVTQLPSDLQPLAPGSEAQLEAEAGPPRTLTAEVLAAWNLIRTRGQVPTPDLIAREIGPGKLAEFLASSPGAANVLATGQEPDSNVAPPGADAERGVTVKTIVPPGQS
jgi:hypothetical protein